MRGMPDNSEQARATRVLLKAGYLFTQKSATPSCFFPQCITYEMFGFGHDCKFGEIEQGVK